MIVFLKEMLILAELQVDEKMETEESREETSDSLPIGVFEIPGEPAVIINGLPPVSSTDIDVFHPETTALKSNMKKAARISLGDWLLGREVRKRFGDQLYNGKVMEFDEESGYYRVVYEDSDFEDLEWGELQEVLLPLDITVPLKTLASKVTKMKQKSNQKMAKSGSRSRG